jgi:hypothetical protein
MLKIHLIASALLLFTRIAFAEQLHVNSATGNDAGPGTLLQPLKTLREAAVRVNMSYRQNGDTIFLAGGVYPLTETVLFNNSKYTSENRLTIRAEILPDDQNWHPQKMPIILSAITIPQDINNAETRGFEIETNHVTVQGLRFTGTADYYYIDSIHNRRYYPIWREGRKLEDLLVTQCMFIGSGHVSPIRVAVIANGNGLVLDHCVFFNCENSVVFWNTENESSHNNAMRYCIAYESNYSGVWTTAQVADDFEFHHNIIVNGRAAWIRDDNSTHHYQIHDCIITGNQKLTANGRNNSTQNDFLTMENVKLTGTIELEKDKSKINYMQLKEGSFGTSLKAGLFKKIITK